MTMPKLLFFRWTKPGLAPFLAQHLDAQTRTLGHFFDVKVIDYDCDYGSVCDEFAPDISIFESGVYSGARRITNTSSHPEIPKLGFLHSDAYDIARAVFLSDMERWGVSDFFTTSAVMAEYTPEIADNIFVWPNAVNPLIFRDYDLEKNIPVLFTGSQERHYPWRNMVNDILSARYVTMSMPHFGWGQGTQRMIVGREYARLLNASKFVPACGSMAGEVVRKQLEIPASNACLITERTYHLETFGFKDMENCVFADSTDILDKLEYLNGNEDVLWGVTKAGFDLVHSRHTEAHRSQVLEWLTLRSGTLSGQRIRQHSPSSALYLSQGNSQELPVGSKAARPKASDRTILENGWRLLRSGEVERAEKEFLRCLNYYFIPEAITGRVFSSLANGKAEPALEIVTEALMEMLEERGAEDPDPVLWACLLRSLVCAGEDDRAKKEAQRFPYLRHPELDRVRLVMSAVFPARLKNAFSNAIHRPSVMAPPPLMFDAWVLEFAAMADRCGNLHRGQTIRAAFADRPTGSLGGSALKPSSLGIMHSSVRRAVRLRLRTGPVQRLRVALSPYKQRIFSDEGSEAVASIIRRQEVDCAALIGKADRRQTAAVKLGVRMNTSLPPLFRSDLWDQAELEGWLPSGNARVLVVLNFESHQDPSYGLGIGHWLTGYPLLGAVIIIYGTNTPAGYRLLSFLFDSGRSALLLHRNDGKPGLAILRLACPRRETPGGII